MTTATDNQPYRYSVLRLLLEIPETNAPYQALSKPLASRHRITICTYFPVTIEIVPEIRVLQGDGSLRGFARVLRRTLADDRYEIVHAHTPHVALVYLFLSLLRPWRLQNTVFTVHNCFENHKFRNKLMLIPVFIAFRRIVCCSRSSYESFPRLCRRLLGRRMCYVPNGVDTQRVDAARKRLGTPSEEGRDANRPFTVLSAGRLVPIKNIPTTIDAFARVRRDDARLVVVGDGPLRETLAAQGERFGTESSVEFTGLLSRDEVFRQMLRSDLFVSPSYGEGLPVAVLEAMACGCPVILSDIAPHREIAAATDFIPLVDAEDTEAWAGEIDRFQTMCQIERRAIGAKCARWVQERFSLDAMHRRYEAIYDEVIPNSH